MNTKNDKVFELVASFSNSQLRRFKDFLLSPYFNKNTELLTLFLELERCLLVKSPLISRENVWKRVFPSQKYESQRYRRLCSDLTKLGYKFLSIEWYEGNYVFADIGAMMSLNQSGLGKHYLTALRTSRREMERNSLRNANYHYYQYLTEYESHQHLEKTKVKQKSLSNLELADEHLERFFIINKLKHYCDALNYKTFLSIDVKIDVPFGFWKYIEQKNYYQDPVVKIYRLIYLTITDSEDTTHYFELEKLLEEHHALFPRAELQSLYVYATNFVIQQINKGKKEFLKILYELYYQSLKRETLMNDKGFLDYQHYKNIITLGIQQKDYDRTEDFITNYSSRLKEKFRENAMNFNLANLYFRKKDFPKVIEQLRYVEYQDVFYALDSKLTLLKTYYELKEDTAFDSALDTFRNFLRRNKRISKELKISYLNFLKMMKRVANTRKKDQKSILKLEGNIQEISPLNNKKWLLEKLEELK